MKRMQAFKYELKPNSEQVRSMRRFSGSCRFVFNKALAMQKARYGSGEKNLGYAGLCKELTAWRNSADTEWLAGAPVHPLQQSLKDLDRAYKNYFEKRAEFPRFKKKGLSDSFRYPDPKQFKLDQPNSRIFLPKLGWVRYRNSRMILGAPKNITVSLSNGSWYASIQTEREVIESIHSSISMVGIDVGITRFVTLSDGSVVEPMHSFKKHEKRLAALQRQMAHKAKFSSNWKKAKSRVSKLHAKIANVRHDYLHKTTTTLSKNHALVVIEDLQVKNMSASARGTVAAPGRKVRQKAGLNKSILDQGWFEFRRQLTYKQEWLGGIVLVVPAHHTSQTCPVCSHVSPDNRKTQAEFMCVECSYEDNADLVAAKNILERGHRLLACGDPMQQDRSVKQEPTDATTQRLVLV